jgi:transposase-like protein
MAEIMAERGIEVDASCIWRWVQAYAPELDKIRQHRAVRGDAGRI